VRIREIDPKGTEKILGAFFATRLNQLKRE
jgi:hypothetical protein